MRAVDVEGAVAVRDHSPLGSSSVAPVDGGGEVIDRRGISIGDDGDQAGEWSPSQEAYAARGGGERIIVVIDNRSLPLQLAGAGVHQVR